MTVPSAKLTLGLLAVAAAFAIPSVNAQNCDTSYSCKTCGTGCQWCAVVVTTDDNPSPPLMGRCIEASTSCDSVKFGDLETLVDVPKSVAPEAVSVSVVPIANDDAKCNTNAFPSTLASATCKDCTGFSYTWCDVDVSVGEFKRSGGLCVPPGLQPLCDSTLVPVQPIVTVKLSPYSTVAQCDSKTPDAKPAASATCGENYSCDTCGKSSSTCTWCGLVDNDAPVTISLNGVCVDGTVTDCSTITGNNEAFYGELIRGATYAPVAKTEDHCTAVDWPKRMQYETCEECIKDKSAGWCRVGGLPHEGREEPYGMCVDKSIGWICELEPFKSEVESQFALTCGADPPTPTIPPPIPASTPKPESTTTTAKPSAAVSTLPVATVVLAATGATALLAL